MNQPKKSKSLIAMKFGGTSVGSAERMQGVAEIIADHARHDQLVVVTSAMADVTDRLLRAASAAGDGAGEDWSTPWKRQLRRSRADYVTRTSGGVRLGCFCQLLVAVVVVVSDRRGLSH